MKRINLMVVFLLLYTSVSFSQEDVPEFISIIALVSTAGEYDGKVVRVMGAVQLEFEGNLICLSKDDLTQGLTKKLFMDNVGW